MVSTKEINRSLGRKIGEVLCELGEDGKQSSIDTRMAAICSPEEWQQYLRFSGRSNAVLTDREKSILHLISQGKTNKEICCSPRFGISEQTIKNHVTTILRKLNATNRTHAAMLGVEKGLVEVPNGGNGEHDSENETTP